MKFWCFKFEGWFADDAPEYAGEGVFSECLVPLASYADAEFGFLEALAKRHINLIEIEEHFPLDTDPTELDYQNPDNNFWVEWADETEAAGVPTFEAFHLYPASEVDRSRKKGN